VGILQAENVAYSSPSEIFVNRLEQNCFPTYAGIDNKEVDPSWSGESYVWCGFQGEVCGKAEDARGKAGG